MQYEPRTIKPESREKASQLQEEVNRLRRAWADTGQDQLSMKAHRWFNWTRADNMLSDFCWANRNKNVS